MSSAHPVDIHVGKRLRFCRTMQGLNQRALGDAIGVTFQQIQKYERGVNRMGSSRLYEFSKLLSVPVSYFFEGFEGFEGEKPSELQGLAESKSNSFDYEKVTDTLMNKETADLIRAYHQIPNPQRKKMFEMIKSVADTYTS